MAQEPVGDVKPALPRKTRDVVISYDPGDGAALCTVGDAAKLSNVSKRTIYNWIGHGWVKVRRLPSGRQRIEVRSLMRRGDLPGQGSQSAAAEVAV
jgi:hypothetical protein